MFVIILYVEHPMYSGVHLDESSPDSNNGNVLIPYRLELYTAGH